MENVNQARLDSVRKRNKVASQHAQMARDQFRVWLGTLRLMDHEPAFKGICGQDMAIDDLRFLRQADIDKIATGMS